MSWAPSNKGLQLGCHTGPHLNEENPRARRRAAETLDTVGTPHASERASASSCGSYIKLVRYVGVDERQATLAEG